MAGAQDKVISLDQAGAMIAARKILSLAGSHSVNSPMALIRAAIRAGASALSIIPPVTTSIASDLLIAAGAVDTFYLCYIGFETLGFAPAFRAAAEAGTLNVIEGEGRMVCSETRLGEKRCKTHASTSCISTIDKILPRQMRGPPPKGKNANFGRPADSSGLKRSGRKLSGSCQYSGRR